MDKINCKECGEQYEVKIPKFCSRICFHTNYGKNHRAEKHYKWKGDLVGYPGLHSWLRKFYGIGGICEICGENSLKLNWALVKGKKYEMKRENFKHLCASCHKNYDMADEIRSKMSLAHKKI